MKNNPIELTDLFIRHSRKELSESELADFNQKLTYNTDFKSAFQEYELSRNFFIQKELFDVKDLLTEFKNTPPPPNYTNYWIGGTFILLLIGVATFFGLKKEKSIENKTVTSTAPIITTKKIQEKVISLKNSVIIKNEISITSKKKQFISSPEKTIINKEVEQISQEVKTINIKDSTEKIIEKAVIKNDSKTEKIVTKKTVKEVVIAKPCPKIEFDLLTKKPCENQDNGGIRLTNIQGGTSPYVFIFESEEQKDAYFKNLISGNYYLKIIDQKGCFVEKNILLENQSCIQKEYEFSYNYQSYLEIPIQETGVFTILNKEGKQLISLNLNNDNLTEWNGLDAQGNELAIGLYPIIITTNNQKTTGSLRIYP